MGKFFPVALMGLIAGCLDIAPMIRQKLPRHSICSAFLFHLTAPFLLFNSTFPLRWWEKGPLVYFLLFLPLFPLIASEDPKATKIVCVTTLLFSLLISWAGYTILGL
ncbi:MAG: hypothetical protein LBT15_06320 [Synergistaceae bacterium]|jgi:hypothetical protein|nr:hypothetical protein [Synergistaceae bacterium]